MGEGEGEGEGVCSSRLTWKAWPRLRMRMRMLYVYAVVVSLGRHGLVCV